MRQIVGSVFSRRKGLLRREYTLSSKHLQREVLVTIYRPAVPPWRLLSLVVFNDGQDLSRMQLGERLKRMYKTKRLPPTLVVGVHAANRMREYGTASKRDHAGNGAAAAAYQQFLIDELLPWLQDHNNIYHTAERRAIAGFSLGGLSAFDTAWNHPRVFRTAGIFSGSLWYRSKAYTPKLPDANRIVHDYVRRHRKAIANRFWFMAGTADETEDRNHNGVIDSIDDTLQLMALLQEKGLRPEEEMMYVEVEGGTHDPETWGKVVGDFLEWAVKG
ncbi:enterochelin esterase-like enzyme [Neolewinella xylanilytica]|uniref:Enterochelin esterase-like enzyme n=1 Tax=Neolewinella xylanilytica TaxID=1514080 RepID=A0A2S6I2D4_9BACT|nr:enterochelin esterase-like enzyme [Neolewinella xylanilytica]